MITSQHLNTDNLSLDVVSIQLRVKRALQSSYALKERWEGVLKKMEETQTRGKSNDVQLVGGITPENRH